jgi:hypothetical protein
MKSEKGKQVFVDNVDILLSDRIIGHTRKNADGKYAGAAKEASHHVEGLMEKDQDMKKPKTGFLKFIIGGAIVIAGLIVFFLCKEKWCCCGKKGSGSGIFRLRRFH